MKEIKAREGYYLTQVGNVGNERIYITALKGANINDEDWREATEAEKQGYEEEQARQMREAEEQSHEEERM